MPYRYFFLLAYLLIFTTTGVFAQSIIEAEYFIDVDPGVGKGIKILITEPSDTLTFDGKISTNNLIAGEHILVIRIKNDEGVWSLGNYTRFFVEEAYTTPQPQNIIQAEFYVDSDPGTGVNPSFSSTIDSTITKIEAKLATQNLTPGTHQLIVRTQAANGTWSLGNYSSFYVEQAYTPFERDLSKIKKVEYFIDGPDPGFNAATELLPPTPDFTVLVSDTLLMSQDVADLGRHAVLARLLTEDEEWSLTGIGEFDYCSPEGVIGGYEASIKDNIITLTDSSRHAVDYIWDMNNGDSLFEAEPIYTYPQGGTYTVCQTAYSFCDTAITCKTFNFPTPRIKNYIHDLYIAEDSGPLTIIEDLNTVFEDGDGDILTFSASSNEPDVLATIINNSLVIESINDSSGIATVLIGAEGGGVTTYDTILVDVFPVNDLPIAKNGFSNVTWDEDSGPRLITRNLNREITDVEDRRLDFVVYSDSEGLQPILQTDSLLINLLPNYNGEGNIFIEATDDSLATSTFSFYVSLLPIPDPPVVIKDFEDISIFEDSEPYLVTPALSTHFTDPDGNNISIEVNSSQEFITPNIKDDSLTLIISPDIEGIALIEIIANDGTLTTIDTIQVTILPENDAPKFNITSQYTICAEQMLEIDLRALVSDTDGFFEDIRTSITVESISESALFPSDLNNTITDDNYLQFTSNSSEAAQVALNLRATDLQNATNDTTILIDILGASISQIGDTLIANSGNNYQWYKGGTPIVGATQDKFVPTKRDFYQVSVRHNNCEILSAPFQVTNNEEEQLFKEVNIYPNPTNKNTTISFSGNFIGKVDYIISDIKGSIIQKGSFDKKSFQFIKEINLQSIPTGFYIIRLSNNESFIIKKLYKYE